MYSKLFIILIVLKLLEYMKLKSYINFNNKYNKKRPYPYLNDNGNEFKYLLPKLVPKNLKINSYEYICEKDLIKKYESLSIKPFMNCINNEIETNTINVNRNILNNSFYSIINVIDDDQENINIITEENDIINMINKYYYPKTTIIEYKKNKKNKGKNSINNNNDKSNYKENKKKIRLNWMNIT